MCTEGRGGATWKRSVFQQLVELALPDLLDRSGYVSRAQRGKMETGKEGKRERGKEGKRERGKEARGGGGGGREGLVQWLSENREGHVAGAID